MTQDIPLRYRLAHDSYEARIENAILRAEDLYDLDGETLFRIREGQVETGDADIFAADAWR